MAVTQYRANTRTGRAAGAVIVQEVQTPTFASTLAITPSINVEETVVAVTVTGICTLTANVLLPLIGDRMRFFFIGDTVDRVMTFSTGFGGITTFTVPANSAGVVLFTFFNNKWICSTSGAYTTLASDVQTPAYAATITLTTTVRSTVLLPATLTGALTINAVVTSAVAGDTLYMSFVSDSTGRVVTFGTNFKSSGTLTLVASKWAGATAVFNGTFWVLTGREISA